MKNKSSRVQTNLLQQNCFVRDCAPDVAFIPPKQSDVFVALDEITDDNGIHFEEKEYPYPITPQYVNSFVDSADYRKDPSGAIANGVKRPNLGDVSGIQKVMSMSDVDAKRLYEQLSAKFAKKDESPTTQNNEVK